MDVSPRTSARPPTECLPAERLRELHFSRSSVLQGVVALLSVYALIGAGIGAVIADALAGLVVGVGAGLCAVAAILLICGAGVGAEHSAPNRF